MTGERAFKKKFLLGKLFFHQYESNKHGGFKIREMTATSFGRFHMESPINIFIFIYKYIRRYIIYYIMKYSNNYMYILMKIATVVIGCRNQQYASGV